MADSQPQSPASHQEDPIYRHSLREARFILGLWTCCFIYTVTYCYLNGYITHEALPEASSAGPSVGNLVGPLGQFNRDPATLSYPFGLGIPDWVFYGVALPWTICVVLSFWFGLAYFVEDDLSDPSEAATDGAGGRSADSGDQAHGTQQEGA